MFERKGRTQRNSPENGNRRKSLSEICIRKTSKHDSNKKNQNRKRLSPKSDSRRKKQKNKISRTDGKQRVVVRPGKFVGQANLY